MAKSYIKKEVKENAGERMVFVVGSSVSHFHGVADQQKELSSN